MSEHLSKKYKFLLFSLVSISLPFLEFINFNLNDLGPPEFKTLAYTIIFFISFLFLFSLIVSILFRKDLFEIFFLCAIMIYIIFNYDKLKLLIINLSSKITSFTFQGELSLMLIFVIMTIFLFFFIKKSSSFLNFIYIYFIVLFIINMANFIIIQKNQNETIYQELFSNNAYFTEDEIKGIKDNKNNKNIYFIILEGALSLKLYNDNFMKIDEKKIISDFKKLNFNYIEDVRASYTNTALANSQILNLDYHLNEKSPARTHYTKLFPWIMSNFETTPLGKILEKIDYDFFWVGHSRYNCSYYNISLCMHHEKRKKNIFKNIIPNIPHNIHSSHVLENFLQKSPILDIIFTINFFIPYKDLLREIKHFENDVIKRFLKFSKDLEKSKKKNHFVLIHPYMPLSQKIPKDVPIVFNEDCSIRTASKNLQELGEDIGKTGGWFYGYDTNYICMLKRVKEFAEFIKISDPEAIVIFQSDHGFSHEGIMYQKIFTLVKTSEECKRHLSNQIDNINAIRLMMSCATNQEVKLLKKKSFNSIDGKLFLVN